MEITEIASQARDARLVLFFLQDLLDFSVTIQLSGRTTTSTCQRIGRSLLLCRLDEPKLDQPKPTLVGPELDQQRLS